MKVPAIVIAAYNRPHCLARLLRSVAAAQYDSVNIPLIISIDKSDVAEVYALADAFEWKHGEKQVIRQPEQLGLKEHILSCADLSSQFESIILLEDDLLVSPFFYRYTQQALSFYAEDKSIAGISLYSYQVAENRFFPFYPHHDGSSVYFMQLPSSWGEVFTAASWSAFRQWNANQQENFPEHILPEYIQEWSVHSWKKRFAAYMMDTDKYFVFPRHSYSTNFGDEGVNTDRKGLFQVPLVLNEQHLQFNFLNDSLAVYDAWFELTAEVLKELDNRFRDYDLCVDLYGTKKLSTITTAYLLSSKKCISPMLSFGNELTNSLQSVLCSEAGSFFAFGKTSDFTDSEIDRSAFWGQFNSIKDIVFNESQLKRHRELVENFELNKQFPKLFIGVLYNGNQKELLETLESIRAQKYPVSQINVTVFCRSGESPHFDEKELPITCMVSANAEDFLNILPSTIDASDAEYYVLLRSGDVFYSQVFEAVNKIFRRYPDVAWLTGIETIRAENGYNIFIGNTATRRWNQRIYERNLYKNSSRYIPPAATFWKRYTWDSARQSINLVSLKSLHEDIWSAFLKTQKLFTCDVYFSSSPAINVSKLKASKNLVKMSLVEDTLLNRMQEFFFLNNIPYLRTYYYLKNNLPEVIRLEHETQWYFQSDF